MEKQFQDSENLNFEKVWLMFQETDRRFQETDRQFRETRKRLEQLTNLFTTRWGKLMESLIEPSCLNLFKKREIVIERSFSNVKIKRQQTEA